MSEQHLILLTPEQLKALLHEVVTEAMAGFAPNDSSALLDRQQLANQLGCSTTTVYRMCKQGCPRVMVLDSPRFELTSVLEWISERSASRRRQKSSSKSRSTGQLRLIQTPSSNLEQVTTQPRRRKDPK